VKIRDLLKDLLYRIDLDADYQREKVWTKSNQEDLLDSIVKGIDIPKLYLAEVESNSQFDYECIDGKQRLLAISMFANPDRMMSSPLTIDVHGAKYGFNKLKADHPLIAQWIEEFELDFVVYKQSSLTEDFTRLIFRRLQLGIRLNSGEILKSLMGTVRDFVFKEMGNEGPFLRNTRLSEKRYSRQFTLAQICINSFHRARHGEFVRARLLDLESFFEENESLPEDSEDLERIRKVLGAMDDAFGERAQKISSRAVAVSAYLFVEELVIGKRMRDVPAFVDFFCLLLGAVDANMKLVSKHELPQNPYLLDGFQKHVLQASVEPNAILRRHEFLRDAFRHYCASATRGKLPSERQRK
jgi:hypothetical protein